jgi:hypothetical protein
MRHGLPAGISTGLAFSAGALTNVFTKGVSGRARLAPFSARIRVYPSA